jgi:uncharacterized protein YebE (UPF0316 family)
MNADVLFALPWGPVLIFCLRIVDVSLDTMRVIFAIRGKRMITTVLGFFMVLVWIFAVGNAVKHLDNIWYILGYAGGYAAGTYVGITLEAALAYGVVTLRIVSRHTGVELAEALRERGYGVTEFPGFGRDGAVEIVDTAVQRSHLQDVLALVQQWDSAAFVTVEEPKILRGGSIVARDWRFGGPIVRWMKTRQRA